MTYDLETFKADIPGEILALLDAAGTPFSERKKAEEALLSAVQQAPDNLALRIATYTFYFYTNQLQAAIPHAEVCLAIAADSLGVSRDWREVTSESAQFNGLERPQRVYLKSLVALGFCRARLGDVEAGEELLRKAASLDPQDKVGAAGLVELVKRGGVDEDDDEL